VYCFSGTKQQLEYHHQSIDSICYYYYACLLRLITKKKRSDTWPCSVSQSRLPTYETTEHVQHPPHSSCITGPTWLGRPSFASWLGRPSPHSYLRLDSFCIEKHPVWSSCSHEKQAVNKECRRRFFLGGVVFCALCTRSHHHHQFSGKDAVKRSTSRLFANNREAGILLMVDASSSEECSTLAIGLQFSCTTVPLFKISSPRKKTRK